jgi:hypothetical protein
MSIHGNTFQHFYVPFVDPTDAGKENGNRGLFRAWLARRDVGSA